MIVAALAALALAPSLAARTLDVVFVPDAAGAPPLVIVLDDGGGKRTLTWLFADEASGVVVDDATAHDLFELPSAPKGSSVSDRDGLLSITVDDAGSWQDALRALPSSKVPALPLPGSTSLRLVVDPSSVDPAAASATGNPGGAAAVLYGADVKLAGRAVIHKDAAAVRVVVIAGKDVVDAEGTALDVISACARTVPSAVSVVGVVSLKLFASGPAVCAGALAIVPVSGTKLDVRKDVPAQGVVVAR